MAGSNELPIYCHERRVRSSQYRETGTPPMTDDLERRLRAVESSGLPSMEKGVTTCWYRNPDGPDAADAIARLRAENEALREALEPFAAVADTVDETGRTYEDDDRINIVQAFGCLLAEVTEDEFRRARQALQEGSRHE